MKIDLHSEIRNRKGGQMITVGIDVGSITTKAAVVKDGKLIADRVISTGYNAQDAGTKVYENIMDESGIPPSSVIKIISTGYGRNSVAIADKAVTEITCHAAGAHFLNPSVRAIIDIGGQDSKAIVVDETGSVKDFAMNDKCAAGTGRFLEVMARALEVDLDNFGKFSLEADTPARISSLCTVFCGIRSHLAYFQRRKEAKYHCRNPRIHSRPGGGHGRSYRSDSTADDDRRRGQK